MIKQQQQNMWVMIGILLIAVFLRVWQFDEAPPGLQHDEIFKAQEGQRLIKEGDFRIFYPSNQGHEGGFVWVLGISYVLFGTTFMMIKFPALMFGILTVAMLYRFCKEVYGHFVGVIASGLASVSIWGIFTSRVGLRAVMLPFVTLMVLWSPTKITSPKPCKSLENGIIYRVLARFCNLYLYCIICFIYGVCSIYDNSPTISSDNLPKKIFRVNDNNCCSRNVGFANGLYEAY